MELPVDRGPEEVTAGPKGLGPPGLEDAPAATHTVSETGRKPVASGLSL